MIIQATKRLSKKMITEKFIYNQFTADINAINTSITAFFQHAFHSSIIVGVFITII